MNQIRNGVCIGEVYTCGVYGKSMTRHTGLICVSYK